MYRLRIILEDVWTIALVLLEHAMAPVNREGFRKLANARRMYRPNGNNFVPACSRNHYSSSAVKYRMSTTVRKELFARSTYVSYVLISHPRLVNFRHRGLVVG